MDQQYSFPVKNIYEAIAVTQQDLDFERYFDKIYVPLDDIRSKEQLQRLKFYLGIADGELANSFNGINKILFYGHTGCGKSTELWRFHNMVNKPELYFSVFCSIESDMDVNTFEREDIFVLIITKLVQQLQARKIKFNQKPLNDLAFEWLGGNEEITKELQENFSFEIGTEASAGFDFWKFLALKTGLKDVFSTNNKTTQTIRTKIKSNPSAFIHRLNSILNSLRTELKKQGSGSDLLFIIDGTEKLRGNKYDTFLETFIRGASLILDISANLIVSIPIDAYYDMRAFSGRSQFPHEYLLPMVEMREEAIPVFSKIVTKRVDFDTFFEQDAIEFCVKMSGGNPRQLLRIANLCLQNTLGMGKVTLENAQKSTRIFGLQLWKTLTGAHKQILRSGQFDDADEIVLQLLFNTALLEYNGTAFQRKVNPLLQPFLNET